MVPQWIHNNFQIDPQLVPDGSQMAEQSWHIKLEFQEPRQHLNSICGTLDYFCPLCDGSQIDLMDTTLISYGPLRDHLDPFWFHEESLGFLSGNQSDKMGVFWRPIGSIGVALGLIKIFWGHWGHMVFI